MSSGWIQPPLNAVHFPLSLGIWDGHLLEFPSSEAGLALLIEGSSTFQSLLFPTQNLRDSQDLVFPPQLFQGDFFACLGYWEHDCAELTSKQKSPPLSTPQEPPPKHPYSLHPNKSVHPEVQEEITALSLDLPLRWCSAVFPMSQHLHCSRCKSQVFFVLCRGRYST